MEIKTKNWGTEKPDLTSLSPIDKFRLSEIHSFEFLGGHLLFVGESYEKNIVVMISIEELNKALSELGYKITEK